ncbi:MAG TPA: DUF1302 domain-containing protein [Candidatus Binatia bacterium]|nr:DUF1302 domain-containing protein [Candidatus Binatia bacterium]
MKHLISTLVVLVLCLLPCAAMSWDFRVADVEGLADVTLAYGLLSRMQGRDKDLIAIVNGGTLPSANADDGDLNQDPGLVSNMVRTTGEVTLRWRNFGVYVRGFAFYDFQQELHDLARTQLSGKALNSVGKNIGLLDHYLSARFHIGGVPVQLRLGDQVINWGDASFLRFGVDTINPLNLVALFQPTSTARDLSIPQGMLWGAASVTENLAVEGLYQYDWQRVRVPPVGWFFSTNDLIGAEGLNYAMAGAGRFSDLGTNLDTAFDLPPGTLGFDPNFMKIFPRSSNPPPDGGQYGFAVRTFIPQLNAAELSVYFLNYHSRLALINGFTANQAAIDATSSEAVDARANELVPKYEAEGLSPEQAKQKAQVAAETLTIGKFANATRYFAAYPENIKMLGFSFNTALLRTGTLLSGEISHHLGFPVQIPVEEVLAAALSPIQFTPVYQQTPLGAFGANTVVRGFIRRDKTQLELGLRQLFGPRLRSSQTIIGVDIGWVHIHNWPASQPLDEDSWGYRLVGLLTYDSVLGGVTLQPRVVWAQDVDGVTPGPAGAFIAGRRAFNVGLEGDYVNRWTADLSYTQFFGGGSLNMTRDRAFLSFQVGYHY